MDLVFLHGRPASGKLTTARALHKLLGYPVFHNHLVVDLLTPFFPFGSAHLSASESNFGWRSSTRRQRADRSITFTFTPDDTSPLGSLKELQNAVNASGGRVRFVCLTVDDSEQERRVMSQAVASSSNSQTWTPSGDFAAVLFPSSHRVDLEIDTMASSPHQSAD